jgi:ADP-heptose:LPS heptosyltransferase
MTRLFYTDVVAVSPDQHGVDIGFAHVGMDPEGQNRQMEFSVTEARLGTVAEYLRRLRWSASDPIVGIHPGCLARHRQKRWPIGRFAAVAQWLVKKKRCRVLIFLGPDEKELQDPLAEHLGGLGQSCHIDTDAGLDDTAALMKVCDVFVSNDSGLMHLASAVGTPVLGIFGPTNPKRYAPSGPRDRYLHHTLECSNCYDAKTMTSCRSGTCLEMITAEQVQNEIDDMLDGDR